MIIHVHSKNGHADAILVLQNRLASAAYSLDPMPDGSTATALEVSHPAIASDILSQYQGFMLIPCDGFVGKDIANALKQYGVKESDVKKDVLGKLHGAQPNIHFHPTLCDL